MLKYSMGDLVDKLTIVHLKLWHLEEKVQSFQEDMIENPTQEMLDILDQIVSLNKFRVEIVESINELFEELKHEG